MLATVDPLYLLGAIFGIGIVVVLIVMFVSRLSRSRIKKLQEELYAKDMQLQKCEKDFTQLRQDVAHGKGVGNSNSFITEQIKKIEDLEERLSVEKKKVADTKELVKEAHRVKDIFLSNIRHEIRTPLNSILVFSDMLRQEIASQQHKGYATNILQAGRKLLSFVDELIELADLESGEVQTEETAIECSEFFSTIARKYQQKAQKKMLSMTFEIDPQLPLSIKLDQEKVREILANLLDNAIKFTKEGSIDLSVELRKTNVVTNTVNVAFVVKDSGVGIQKQDFEKIFSMFEKKEDASHEEFQSTGLRLSINRKMARLLGGDITLQSKPGEGSTFTLLLENLEVVLQNQKGDVDEAQIDFHAIKPSTLLVIDEDQESRAMVIDSLEFTECSVHHFNNPRDAIELLKTKKVDLILIDLFTLTEEDNAVSKVLAKISEAPVVTLTKGSVKGKQFVQSGVRIVGHLQKPLTSVALFSMLLKVINGSRAALSSESMEGVDPKNLQMFLSYLDGNVASLYQKASTTHDLSVIEQFANTVFKLALKYKIPPFEAFAKELLREVELFDIEAVALLLEKYKQLKEIAKK